ncbi:TolB family protein [Anaerocolumna jejuensis]|uniref:TolB family protein n=1 Tax=Anaerocolumna jejuensis TaxID=259063 RepID=UPI003F7BD6F3
MKKKQITKIIFAMILLITTTGCSTKSNEDKVTIKEPGGSITVIDNTGKEAGAPEISIAKIDSYKKLEISDWLDGDTVVVSKENESLEKMKLEELSDSYPRSLYLYNLKTKEYKLLKEEAELNLGGAKLSSDKKNLLYSGNSLGDLSYYVLNLENLKSFGISGDPIGSAGSANWADKNTVIGAGYTNGAYSANMEGKITSLKELDQKSIFIIKKLKDSLYYNTADDNTIMALNLSTGKVASLNLTNVSGLYPAPDEKQLLALQYKGSKQILSLCDRDGSNVKTIAEGAELGGVSWSPDQRMITYSLKGDSKGAANGLYLYDMLTGKSTLIAVDIWNAVTCWSPSGKELVYTQWDGKQYNSSIVYLEFSLQK